MDAELACWLSSSSFWHGILNGTTACGTPACLCVCSRALTASASQDTLLGVCAKRAAYSANTQICVPVCALDAAGAVFPFACAFACVRAFAFVCACACACASACASARAWQAGRSFLRSFLPRISMRPFSLRARCFFFLCVLSFCLIPPTLYTHTLAHAYREIER